MAKGFGGHSEYIKKNIYINATVYALFLLAIVISAYFSYLLAINLYAKNSHTETFIFFVIYVLVLWGVVIAFKYAFNSDRFLRGGIGETDIRDELDKLPDEYSYFRGIKINGTNYDVDFVVIGPTGIFAIDAKSYTGRIEYTNGVLVRNNKTFKKKLLWQVRQEAFFVNKLILEKFNQNIFVFPVLAFSSFWAKMRFGLNPVEGVFVVQKRLLLKLITDRPAFNYRVDRKLIEHELERLTRE